MAAAWIRAASARTHVVARAATLAPTAATEPAVRLERLAWTDDARSCVRRTVRCASRRKGPSAAVRVRSVAMACAARRVPAVMASVADPGRPALPQGARIRVRRGQTPATQIQASGPVVHRTRAAATVCVARAARAVMAAAANLARSAVTASAVSLAGSVATTSAWMPKPTRVTAARAAMGVRPDRRA